MTKQIFSTLKVITLTLALSFGMSFVYAWTAPTQIPPSGNVSAPINTSGTAQTKAGNLTINGLIKSAAGGAYSQGGFNFNNHSLNSHSNGWLYIGDQNNSVYGGRGLAADYLWGNSEVYAGGIPVCRRDGTNCPPGGITSESDPTVPASVKDGITWTEISSRPAGLDDGDQVGGISCNWSGWSSFRTGANTNGDYCLIGHQFYCQSGVVTQMKETSMVCDW